MNPYISYEEYLELGSGDVTETEFPKLQLAAQFLLDRITNYYFTYNNLDEYYHKRVVKYALAKQLDYYQQMGGTNAQSMTVGGRVQIGRTSIQTSESNSNSQSSSPYGLELSLDAYKLLLGLGLLYRGVKTC